ncbi:o-succinylbenzoate synthase [Hymenobacter sp. BT730]|uniref:o-succinylbenzoate synthase n=1 Tax=Hymenobacter sp. BT730 TaxID=3063332 RepID=UPI0026DF3B6F|nr:o-succinylbenzoate synthase [Hymenobacter sp. BT730]
MALHLRYSRRALQFNFPARTSRGALTEHIAWYLHLTDERQPQVQGIGEAAPLAGLSPDHRPDIEAFLRDLCTRFNAAGYQQFTPEEVPVLVAPEWPSIRFALEAAALDWLHVGRRILFDTAFSRGEVGLPINGLIWMGDAAFMREQIRRKLGEGYSCLKLKIGSLDFATELELLAEIRAVASPQELTLRVDANGAFSPENAAQRLEQLAAFSLHSIEQPVQPGQPNLMATLCQTSPVPIALDEELIGVTDAQKQAALLDALQPAYIILKPTLLGGFAATRRWVALAKERGIGWWLTSALESNIGLNAVSQLTAALQVGDFPQGLGTGQLYHNNIASPLHIQHGYLHYAAGGAWEIPD